MYQRSTKEILEKFQAVGALGASGPPGPSAPGPTDRPFFELRARDPEVVEVPTDEL